MRNKVFGRRAGLRVSELASGAENFGTRCVMAPSADDTRKVFDAYDWAHFPDGVASIEEIVHAFTLNFRTLSSDQVAVVRSFSACEQNGIELLHCWPYGKS